MHGTPYPTKTERRILGHLWAHGTCAAADVAAALAYEPNTAHVSLRRMVARGLIVRAGAPRAYVYAAHPREALGTAILEGL
jgi:predicted transcriptional regulator